MLITKTKKNKAEKISKGYRLKVSTHRLIDKMQVILNADTDTVVTKACKLLYKELKNYSSNHNI